MGALLAILLVLGEPGREIKPWEAIGRADFIVLATVRSDTVNPNSREGARTVWLDVLETWKGMAVLSLEVDYRESTCPGGPSFEPDAPLVVLLEWRGGRLGVVDEVARYPLRLGDGHPRDDEPSSRLELHEAVVAARTLQLPFERDTDWSQVAAPGAWAASSRALEHAVKDLGLLREEPVIVPFRRRPPRSPVEQIRDVLGPLLAR